MQLRSFYKWTAIPTIISFLVFGLWLNQASAAISVSNLTSGNAQNVSVTSQATASISPTANTLLLLTVISRTNITAAPNQPTATGNGLTWVAVKSVNYDIQGTSRKRITVLRAMGPAPTTGAITIDFAGQTQTDVFWSVEQVSGVPTTGTNGSDAVVQSGTALCDQCGGGTLTVNMGAFANLNNATFGAFTDDRGINDGSGLSVGSGFTAITLSNGGTQDILTEWKSTNDTTVDATSVTSTNQNMGGIGIELNAGTSAALYVQKAVYLNKGAIYIN